MLAIAEFVPFLLAMGLPVLLVAIIAWPRKLPR